MNIVFRVDASYKIGSGHLIRCRNLARVFKQRGLSVAFVCREYQINLIQELRDEFIVFFLNKNKINPNYEVHNTYKNWLGCSEEEDAKDTFNALVNSKFRIPNFIFIDSYSIGINWQETINKKFKREYNISSNLSLKYVFIDDIANRNFKADILINQNYYPYDHNNEYKFLTIKPKIQLIGSYFSILGKEYLLSMPFKKNSSKNIKRILIYFGSSDQTGINLFVAKILKDKIFDHFFIDFVLPQNNKDNPEIIDLLNKKSNVKTYFNLPSLFDLIKNADLSIGAGGTSNLERLYMKLDSFVISVASNQKKICERLHSNKFIYYLGHVGTINPKKVILALSMYINNKIYFEDPHFIIDNKGIDRIYSLFAGAKSPFIIREANFEDIYILWNWRNDQNVRKQSFNKEFVTIEEHKEWFKNSLSNKNRLQFIILDSNNVPLGQVRFDKLKGQSKVLIDISVDKIFRGKKYGKKIMSMAINKMIEEWGKKNNLVANILIENIRSKNLFSKYGFILQSTFKKFEEYVFKFK